MEIKKIETNEKKEFDNVKLGNKKIRFIIIGIVFLICIIAIGIGVYFSLTEKDYSDALNKKDKERTSELEIEELKNNFNDIFKNGVIGKIDNDNIEKNDEEKDIVYVSAEKVESIQNKYNLDVQIPQININNEVIEKYNDEIKSLFQNKASNILAGTSDFTVYNVKYQAFINENILSLVIKSNLKEGRNSERVLIKTYNYDFVNNRVVSLNNIIENRNYKKEEIQNKINEEIKSKKNYEISLADLGYSTYSRNLENEMYKLENTNNYIIGENGLLYIIYAYGNNNYTSEVDIVII